jgi:ParB family transcriptional regulator, chromosome partitioning protein
MTQTPRRRLGRGLAALIGEDVGEDLPEGDARSYRHIPIELLHANPNNPRKTFPEDEIEDLARSLRDKGLLQPLVVRPLGEGEYEIVAGERRWRAAQRAGLHDVPVIIKPLNDGEALEIAIVENVQRADLNAVEEAQGYSQLIDRFGYTQQQLADSVGKSRSHIANTLRLLSLPDNVRRYILDGSLTAGHARALVASDAPGELARKIIALGMNVREAENLARAVSGAVSTRNRREKNADLQRLEFKLAEATGLKVEIVDRGHGKGQLKIRYKTFEQLEDVILRLSRAR